MKKIARQRMIEKERERERPGTLMRHNDQERNVAKDSLFLSISISAAAVDFLSLSPAILF